MDEVLKAYCAIGGLVGQHMDWDSPADCICPDRYLDHDPYFQYSPLITDFVRAAVEEKILREWRGEV